MTRTGKLRNEEVRRSVPIDEVLHATVGKLSGPAIVTPIWALFCVF